MHTAGAPRNDHRIRRANSRVPVGRCRRGAWAVYDPNVEAPQRTVVKDSSAARGSECRPHTNQPLCRACDASSRRAAKKKTATPSGRTDRGGGSAFPPRRRQVRERHTDKTHTDVDRLRAGADRRSRAGARQGTQTRRDLNIAARSTPGGKARPITALRAKFGTWALLFRAGACGPAGRWDRAGLARSLAGMARVEESRREGGVRCQNKTIAARWCC